MHSKIQWAQLSARLKQNLHIKSVHLCLCLCLCTSDIHPHHMRWGTANKTWIVEKKEAPTTAAAVATANNNNRVLSLQRIEIQDLFFVVFLLRIASNNWNCKQPGIENTSICTQLKKKYISFPVSNLMHVRSWILFVCWK